MSLISETPPKGSPFDNFMLYPYPLNLDPNILKRCTSILKRKILVRRASKVEPNMELRKKNAKFNDNKI